MKREPFLGKNIRILARGPKSEERTSRIGTGVIFPTVYLKTSRQNIREYLFINVISYSSSLEKRVNDKDVVSDKLNSKK